ncbi:MAG TPA: biopolymer transporter ExbD [Opitutaceae bacterium]|nr:biopolymer transporter ExbD [Opitutaceae bacterium]
MSSSGTSLVARTRRRPELQLVPLIDVLTMLIFFSFVTMQFKSATTLNLKLPKIQTAGKSEFKGKVIISIDNSGVIYFNDHQVADDQLQGLLDTAYNADPNGPIPLLKVDETSQAKKFFFVEDACRKAGFGGATVESRK